MSHILASRILSGELFYTETAECQPTRWNVYVYVCVCIFVYVCVCEGSPTSDRNYRQAIKTT